MDSPVPGPFVSTASAETARAAKRRRMLQNSPDAPGAALGSVAPSQTGDGVTSAPSSHEAAGRGLTHAAPLLKGGGMPPSPRVPRKTSRATGLAGASPTPVQAREANVPVALQQLQWFSKVMGGELPGDLEDMATRRCKEPELYCGRPELALLAALLRPGPPRDAMEVLAHQHPWHASHSVQERIQALRLVLEGVAAAVSLDEASTGTWSDDADRGVAHHSGFLAWLRKLHAIRRAKACRRRAAGGTALPGKAARPLSNGAEQRPRPATLALGQRGNRYHWSQATASQREGLLSIAGAIQTCQQRPRGTPAFSWGPAASAPVIECKCSQVALLPAS